MCVFVASGADSEWLNPLLVVHSLGKACGLFAVLVIIVYSSRTLFKSYAFTWAECMFYLYM